MDEKVLEMIRQNGWKSVRNDKAKWMKSVKNDKEQWMKSVQNFI
jgi:spore coat protein CotF